MGNGTDEYIGVEEAAVLLGKITTRQAHRIGQQARARLEAVPQNTRPGR